MLASTEFTGGQRAAIRQAEERRVYILVQQAEGEKTGNIRPFSYLSDTQTKQKKKKHHLSDRNRNKSTCKRIVLFFFCWIIW